MSYSIIASVAVYLLIGLWLVKNSKSRGLFADCVFVVLWFFHFLNEIVFGGGGE